MPPSAREMVLADDTPDIEEAVRTYTAVLIELGIKEASDYGAPGVLTPDDRAKGL